MYIALMKSSREPGEKDRVKTFEVGGLEAEWTKHSDDWFAARRKHIEL